ncbi:hypothetical protein H310_04883 [Aphanomyces invadans]|uniref:Uncharacterized protein n=1 Tax=Aphanomyces invadans TaxID=157072 RepID=A0A024UAK5_9STRA|nr:hypothetical protein H310_04883 [Aphanomyces invadans]ETW03416.1 hypothetical protein H310_04883 [Aphanomyces invadans]|eukprot:XP_008867645.1 hypothetical protein H310_04883 [Aphanomyces invadans]
MRNLPRHTRRRRQSILDAPPNDPERARSWAVSDVPTNATMRMILHGCKAVIGAVKSCTHSIYSTATSDGRLATDLFSHGNLQWAISFQSLNARIHLFQQTLSLS